MRNTKRSNHNPLVTKGEFWCFPPELYVWMWKWFMFEETGSAGVTLTGHYIAAMLPSAQTIYWITFDHFWNHFLSQIYKHQAKNTRFPFKIRAKFCNIWNPKFHLLCYFSWVSLFFWAFGPSVWPFCEFFISSCCLFLFVFFSFLICLFVHVGCQRTDAAVQSPPAAA